MFALPVILGLCITCYGNFRADAKDQVEPHNTNPAFVQHAYSEKRAKRQSDEVPTGRFINEDQSGQNTNGNQHGQQINGGQYGQNIINHRSQMYKAQSGLNTNDNQHDKHINDLLGQSIIDQRSQNLNDDQRGQNANNTLALKMNDDPYDLNLNGSLSDKDENVYLSDEYFVNEPQSAKTTHRDTVNHNVKHTNRKNNSSRVTKIIPRLRKVAFEYGGKRVNIENPSKMQWHVGIYTKTTTPYMQICGGTLVTLNTVISAAHCFWVDDKVLPVDQFAVGAGKLYRPWSDIHEIHSQTSDVSAIHIPPRYRGSLTNYQDDIAVVQLTLTLKQSPAVLPACLSFDEGLDQEQLGSRAPGTVMGWGLTQQDGRPSQVLNYVELPPLPVDECFEQAGPNFIKFITSDKICAGVEGVLNCRFGEKYFA